MATTGIVGARLLKIQAIADGGTLAAVTCLTSAEMNISNEMRDTTCKDSGIYTDALPDQQTWTMSGEAWVNYGASNGHDEISTLVLSQGLVDVAFGTGVTGDTSFTGSGYLTTFGVSAGVTGNGSFTFELTGVGQLTKGTFS
jgi:predicted secreted protein